MSVTLHGQALFTAIKNASFSDKIVANNDGLSVVGKNDSKVTWKKGSEEAKDVLRVFLAEMRSVKGPNDKPLLNDIKSALMMKDLAKLPLTMKTLKKVISHMEGNHRDTRVKGAKAKVIKFGIAAKGLFSRLFSGKSFAKQYVEERKALEKQNPNNKPTENPNRIWSPEEARMRRIENDKGGVLAEDVEKMKTETE